MARSSTLGKKGCHATWKLDLHAPTNDNGAFTSSPPPSPLQSAPNHPPPPSAPVLYNVYTNGQVDLNSYGLSRVLTLADDGLIYKTASDISTAVTAVQEQLDRMLTYKTQVESTKFRFEKGLSALKAMASKGIEQRDLFLLYQSVILSAIDYGLGLTTLSQSNLLKLDRVQKESHESHSGNNKGHTH